MPTYDPLHELLLQHWPDLSPGATRRLLGYSSTLLTLGTRLGLSSLTPTQASEQIDRSLALAELLAGMIEQSRGRAAALIDVGSGAGLPVVPLAVSLADRFGEQAPKVMLVEPKRKAVAFLEKVFRDLSLTSRVVDRPAEEAASNNDWLRGDFVTAKALAQPGRAVELCAPLCKIGGHIVLTGKSSAGGLSEALPDDALAALGLAVPETRVVQGRSGAAQTIHLIAKESEVAP